MKKQSLATKKLSLEKLQISKLTNLHYLIGGGTNATCGCENPPPPRGSASYGRADNNNQGAPGRPGNPGSPGDCGTN